MSLRVAAAQGAKVLNSSGTATKVAGFTVPEGGASVTVLTFKGNDVRTAHGCDVALKAGCEIWAPAGQSFDTVTLGITSQITYLPA